MAQSKCSIYILFIHEKFKRNKKGKQGHDVKSFVALAQWLSILATIHWNDTWSYLKMHGFAPRN